MSMQQDPIGNQCNLVTGRKEFGDLMNKEFNQLRQKDVQKSFQ